MVLSNELSSGIVSFIAYSATAFLSICMFKGAYIMDITTMLNWCGKVMRVLPMFYILLLEHA